MEKMQGYMTEMWVRREVKTHLYSEVTGTLVTRQEMDEEIHDLRKDGVEITTWVSPDGEKVVKAAYEDMYEATDLAFSPIRVCVTTEGVFVPAEEGCRLGYTRNDS